MIKNPRWLPAYWRVRKRARDRSAALKSGRAAFELASYPSLVSSEREAVLGATMARPEQYDVALADAWIPEPVPGDTTAWESRIVLLRMLATLMRLSPPTVAIEIGVERGFSSSVLLEAMNRAGSGRLFSIDMPALRGTSQGFTGSVIPSTLRDRWELVLGPSQQRLPSLLERIDQVDLFLHDGDHSYESQREDLELVWPHVRKGGIVVVDDVWSPALIDFAGAVGERPWLVRRWDDHDAVGLVRKSS
jgi:hypothetical protein